MAIASGDVLREVLHFVTSQSNEGAFQTSVMSVRKSIAFLLSLSLSVTPYLAPLEAASWIEFAPALSTRADRGFSIPAELGALKIYGDQNGIPVFHVLTAHGHYKVQKNVEAILHYLKNTYGLDALLIEGSANRLDPDRLHLIPDDSELNERVLNLLAQKALVKGVELFLQKESDTPAYGIEDFEPYRQNRQSLRAVLSCKTQAEAFLKQFDSAIEQQITLMPHSEYRVFLSDKKRFDAHTLDLGRYLDLLRKMARSLWKIDLENARYQKDWPMLVRYYKTLQFEKLLQTDSAQKQTHEFGQDLRRFQSVRGK